MSIPPIKIAILVSGAGRGSNMQCIIDACMSGHVNGSVVLVVGTKAGAPALERAAASGIPTAVVSPKQCADNAEYDCKLLKVLQDSEADLICLAGYMRLLGQECIAAYRNRIMNIHPALVPSFCGAGMFGCHVHEAVLARGAKVSGATVHFVDEVYDNGPIITQGVVAVKDDDTPDTLAARVLQVEHKIYPDAVALFSQGRLEVVGSRVIVKEVDL